MRAGIHDAGSAGVGLAVGATVLVILLQLVAGSLRLLSANAEVSAASRAAARAAVDAYDQRAGQQAAARVVAESLGSTCRRATVAVAGDWGPGGRVEAVVSCRVPLGDAVVAGFGPERTVRHAAVEVTDRYRGGAGP